MSSSISVDHQVNFLTDASTNNRDLGALVPKLLPVNKITHYKLDSQSGSYELKFSDKTNGTLSHPVKVANGASVVFQNTLSGKMTANKITFDKGQISASRFLVSAELREVEFKSDHVTTTFTVFSKQINNTTTTMEAHEQVSVKFEN